MLRRVILPAVVVMVPVCLGILFTTACAGEIARDDSAMTATPTLEAPIETTQEVALSAPFHLPDGTEAFGWLAHKRGKVESLAFSPDGRILATGHNNGDVVLWEMGTGEQLQLLPHPQSEGGGLVDLAFNSDGALLAVVEALAGQIALWDVSGGKKLRTLDAEGAIGQPLTDVAFSPDGSLLVAAKSSGQSLEPAGRTFVWRTVDWQQLYVLEDAAPPVAFRPESEGLITLSGVAPVAWTPGQEPAPIVEWDLESGKRTGEISVDGFVISLAFSPDGRMLAANVVEMGAGSFTLLLDGASHAQLYTLPEPDGSLGPNTLSFSPNGSQLAVGYQPNRVIIWDTATGLALHDLKGPADWLRHHTFSPDGVLLAGDSSDERILFWEMPGNISAVPGGRCR